MTIYNNGGTLSSCPVWIEVYNCTVPGENTVLLFPKTRLVSDWREVEWKGDERS